MSTHFSALGTHVKLGRAPQRVDERTAKFATYTTTALPAAPSKIAWGTHVPTFPMYGNDRLGDCTCATVGHQAQVWTSMNGEIWTPTEQEVLDLYWATGSEDTGRVEIDVLNYWRNVGFGQRQDKIAGYMQVNTRNFAEVKQAIWLFGGLYIGIALPITAQNQSVWKLVSNAGTDAQPGSWGGHAVNVTAYNSSYITVATWGMRMRMSWGFWNKYVDEAYAVLSPDWATGAKAAPSGFNFGQLQTDLAAL